MPAASPRSRRKSAPAAAAPKVGFVSLGCPKALVDSERILTQLRAEGYETVPSYDAADVVIVNTCGFIDSAVEESLDAIGEAMAENGRVIVTGCLGARREVLTEKFPDLLSITGPQDYNGVMAAVHAAAPPSRDPFLDLLPSPKNDAIGIKLTPRHYAYLKIAEGCNHKCSFCIIPSLRGKLRSRPVDEVLIEAEKLVKAGVQELLVISQDTSAYGLDIKYRKRTWREREYETRMLDLCRGLGSLGDAATRPWVRLHYVYPYPHVDDVIGLMAEGLVLPYLDIPFQHASTSVLKRMKRPAAAEDTLRRLEAWRRICPDLAIRSTFIVGFPGETEAEFETLLDWLDEARLDRVGCFTYSPVEGAVANALQGQVPQAVMDERLARFMEKQAAISAAKLQAKIGNEIDVLIDESVPEGVFGRSKADAPEIDGRVILPANAKLKPGMRIRAVVTSADTHDLFAERIV